MGIHHSEFDEMFSCLEKDIPISLSDAINKWEHIKNNSQVDIRKWIDLLEKKYTALIDNHYSVGTAMTKAWEDYYGLIVEDSDRGYFNLSDLRHTFFNESIDKLETYEDKLVNKADRYPCKSCGWFVWDYRINKGYCNNFCVERKSLKSRCISEVE